MRLGDFDALKKTLEEIISDKPVSIFTDGIVRAIKVIDDAPTVTPKQGEWIVDEDNDFSNFKKCSNCGEVAEWLEGGSQFLSNFCPNCGAKMLKGSAENEW